MVLIPYGRQNIDQHDIDAVVEVLKSDFLTQGPVVPRFESCVAQYCGSKYAVSTNSATSALHLACLALGVGKGDIVWTTPLTFVASANCALYCGANIDFVDIDPITLNISIAELKKKLFLAQQAGTLPKVVIPVHFTGSACDMAAIHELSKQYDFKIIEDASHAIGGSYKNEKIGSCRYSDITVFSFHPVKIITCGEGGMAVCNSKDLAARMELLRSHGITRDESSMTHIPDGAWYYQQIDLGFNYRMTELQAALGLSQMQRIDEFVARRNEIALRYDAAFHGKSLDLYMHPNKQHSSLHLYIVQLKLDEISRSHKEIFDRMRERGIGVNLHYIPVHLHPYYSALGFRPGDFSVAEKYYRRAISLPIYYGLTDEQQVEVINSLCGLLEK